MKILTRNFLLIVALLSFCFINKAGAQNYLFANGNGGSGSDQGQALAKDAAGNIYLAGYYSGTVDFDPGAGISNLTSVSANSDIFLVKYSSNGNFIWAKSMGGTSNDYAFAIGVDAAAHIYIAGSFAGSADFDPSGATATLTSTGGDDIFLARYDSAGNYQWAVNMGGTTNDQAHSMAFDASGNVCICGSYFGTADFDPGVGTANLISAGGSDIFLAKYSSSGNYLWAKSMGGSGFDYSFSLRSGATNKFYVGGYYQNSGDFDPGPGTATLSSAGSFDVYLAQYDSAGNYQWAKSMGGTGFDQGFAIAVDDTGNVCFTGQFNGSADFDPGPSVATLTSAGSNDIFLAKYDSLGNYRWAKGIGGAQIDAGTNLAFDPFGNIFLTGNFQNTVDFDPGPATANHTSGGSSDIYFAKYDPAGNFLSAQTVGGTGDDTGSDILYAGGILYVTGYFNNTVDFDPGAGTASLVASGGDDFFIAGYGFCTNPAITFSGNTTICNGESATLTAAGATTYLWAPGGQNTASITVNPTTPSTYTVTGSNGSCSSSATVTVIVHSLPTVPTITESIGTLTCSLIGMSSYQWSYNGSSLGTCSTQTCVCQGNGYYKVRVTDGNGCSSQSDSLHVTDCLTGIKQEKEPLNVSVIPNPGSGHFTLQIKNAREPNREISVLNVLGERVYFLSKENSGWNMEEKIDLTDLPEGIYFLQILAGEEFYQGRIVLLK